MTNTKWTAIKMRHKNAVDLLRIISKKGTKRELLNFSIRHRSFIHRKKLKVGEICAEFGIEEW